MDLTALVKGLEAKAERTIKMVEGDYIDADGLICCGRCKTPKQTRIKLFNGVTATPMCLCKCAKAKRDREQAEWDMAQRAQRIQRMKRTGFPDSEMTRWTFERDDKTDPATTGVSLRYVEHFNEMLKKGKGLVFYGNVGTGKSYQAACIANALIDKGFPCLVTNFARLINTIQGMYDGKQQYIDSLDQFDLLVIDDLAAERDTEYMGETVFNIIDARYRCGKPLIVTTNLTADELMNPKDLRKKRIYSRVLEMCFPVAVSAKDRRRGNRDVEVMKMLWL